MEKALLFMPDISGFSDFVKDTDLAHSKHIISELLEMLLQSNDLGLKLAEVEGDALFFYKTGNKLPDFDALLRQAKKMFISFITICWIININEFVIVGHVLMRRIFR